MEICIGIISYLPDDKELRHYRLSKLNKLIQQCNRYFKLPIIIIAQNWKNDMICMEGLSSSLHIFNYVDKLGITGARKKLRSRFLELDYDYMIMLDDDSELVGSYLDAQLYLDQIEQHPKMWAYYTPALLKLFAISKEVYALIDFPDGEAEQGDFFEDMFLTKALEKLHPDKQFKFIRTGFREHSNSSRDPYSTWYHGQLDKHIIGDKTRKLIKELR